MPKYTRLFKTFLKLKTPMEAKCFLRDLCTISEIQDMATRWEVVTLLDKKHSTQDIINKTGLSATTIRRISWWLKSGAGGYRQVLKKKSA